MPQVLGACLRVLEHAATFKPRMQRRLDVEAVCDATRGWSVVRGKAASRQLLRLLHLLHLLPLLLLLLVDLDGDLDIWLCKHIEKYVYVGV